MFQENISTNETAYLQIRQKKVTYFLSVRFGMYFSVSHLREFNCKRGDNFISNQCNQTVYTQTFFSSHFVTILLCYKSRVHLSSGNNLVCHTLLHDGFFPFAFSWFMLFSFFVFCSLTSFTLICSVFISFVLVFIFGSAGFFVNHHFPFLHFIRIRQLCVERSFCFCLRSVVNESVCLLVCFVVCKDVRVRVRCMYVLLHIYLLA